MHACRRRIGYLEAPARENRGAELEIEGRPIDAGQKVVVLHIWLGRLAKPEGNFSLHADVWPTAERKGAIWRRQVEGSGFVEIVPDRTRNPVAGPCSSIGEAYLAANNSITPSLPPPPDFVDNRVGVLETISGKPIGEWRHLARRRHGGEYLIGNDR